MSDPFSMSFKGNMTNLLLLVRSLNSSQMQINSATQECGKIINNILNHIEIENHIRIQQAVINNNMNMSNFNTKPNDSFNDIKNSLNQIKYFSDNKEFSNKNDIIVNDLHKDKPLNNDLKIYDDNFLTQHNLIREKELNNIENHTSTKQLEIFKSSDADNKVSIEVNSTNSNTVPYENLSLKEKFFQLKEKTNKRYFQVVYIFKKKIKRMYRIDCMTRKINVNFYHFIKENCHNLEINDELLDFFKNNIRYTSRTKFQEFEKKYPNFKKIYDNYLKSDKFKKLILMIKNKYDEEYLKLFFRHSKNFLNFYLKDSSHSKLGRKFGSKNLKTRMNEFKINLNTE